MFMNKLLPKIINNIAKDKELIKTSTNCYELTTFKGCGTVTSIEKVCMAEDVICVPFRCGWIDPLDINELKEILFMGYCSSDKLVILLDEWDNIGFKKVTDAFLEIIKEHENNTNFVFIKLFKK